MGNLFLDSGGRSGVLVAGIQKTQLKKYGGKTTAQIATGDKKDPLDALIAYGF